MKKKMHREITPEVQKISEVIRRQRADILEDFSVAYLASNTKIKIKDLVLCEQRSKDGLKYRWWFEERKGGKR